MRENDSRGIVVHAGYRREEKEGGRNGVRRRDYNPSFCRVLACSHMGWGMGMGRQ